MGDNLTLGFSDLKRFLKSAELRSMKSIFSFGSCQALTIIIFSVLYLV